MQNDESSRHSGDRFVSTPEPWASEWGEDEHGLWMAFHCGRVRHAMRWIGPGRFLMGSREDEPERRRDETQHEVVLSEGFWLGETACTQELWQEVAGTSPSHFKGQLRPVEQAGWDDVQEFLERVSTVEFLALEPACPARPSGGACLPGWDHDAVQLWRDHVHGLGEL